MPPVNRGHLFPIFTPLLLTLQFVLWKCPINRQLSFGTDHIDITAVNGYIICLVWCIDATDKDRVMNIGYARASTKDQSFDLQTDALRTAGCKRIFTEVITGVRTQSKVLDEVMAALRPKDVLVVWKLDRLGRSLKHLIEVVNRLIEAKIGLKSLNDPIDTITAQGRWTFNIFASLAEFERELIRERTRAGLSATRARGRKGGRPKGLPAKADITAYAAEVLNNEGELSVRQIAAKLKIPKTTLYSYLRQRGVSIGADRKPESV